MKISFVIPAHNEEARIGACIESIQREVARGKYDAEIIIGNNASSDRTKEVALSYPGVQVADEPRKGTNFARQAGFLVSSGDLVANLDADCMLKEGWMAVVMSEFERHPKLVALGGPYIFYDLPFFARAVTHTFQYGVLFAYFFHHFILRSGSQLIGGNCVIRRSALQAIGGYDTSFTYFGDDNDTANRLSRLGPVKFTYRLKVYSSGRRHAELGVAKTLWLYMMSFFATNYGAPPVATPEVDVRAPVEK